GSDAVAAGASRCGDSARLAALVAHLARPGALVLLSDVDALYSGPPDRPGSELIDRVCGLGDLDGIAIGGVGLAGTGTGGMATKVDAAIMVADSGIPAVLTSAHR